MRVDDGDMAGSIIQNIGSLGAEVARLRRQLHTTQMERAYLHYNYSYISYCTTCNVYICVCVCIDEEMVAHYAQEERQMREENVRLERKLQREIERREALCRHLSESESSLEMDEER